MKKLSILFVIMFSFNAISNCEEVYRKAANKRAQTVRIVAFAGALASPGLVLLSGGVLVTSLALGGMLGGSGVGKIYEAKHTTFGKVYDALKGDPAPVLNKVARTLRKQGLTIDKEDGHFREEVKSIINDLNLSEKACPYMGYDKKFRDINMAFNLREFSKLIAAEYMIARGI